MSLRVAVWRASGISLGPLVAAAVGLALYQVTSLELGPRAHDFQVNLDFDPPFAQDVAQPLEKVDALLGPVSVVLRTAAPTSLVVRRPATASAATVSAPPASAVQPLPIIGRCQNRWTGLSSATSPSNGWGRGLMVTWCWGAGGRF